MFSNLFRIGFHVAGDACAILFMGLIIVSLLYFRALHSMCRTWTACSSNCVSLEHERKRCSILSRVGDDSRVTADSLGGNRGMLCGVV